MPLASFSSFPDELIILLAHYLGLVDRLRFSEVGRKIHGILSSSLSLEYEGELEYFAVVPNYSCFVPIRERLQCLRHQEELWSFLSGTHTTIPVSKGGQFGTNVSETVAISRGVFASMTSHQSTNRTQVITLFDLPRDRIAEPAIWSHELIGIHVVGWTVDSSQDLMALAARQSGGIGSPYRIYIRTMSKNEPHALAATNWLDVPFESRLSADEAAARGSILIVHVHGVFLGVQCAIGGGTINMVARGTDVVVVWNWTTGEMLCSVNASPTSLRAFTFLSGSGDILVARIEPLDKTACLDVYTLQPNDLGSTCMRLWASLELPRLRYECYYTELSLHRRSRTHPMRHPDTRYRYSSQLHYTDPTATVLCFGIAFSNIDARAPYLLFIDERGVYRFLEAYSEHTPFASKILPVPWKSWGPEISRWIPYADNIWGVCSHGYRHAWLIEEEDRPWSSIRLFDFNPLKVTRHDYELDGASDGPLPHLPETEPTVIQAFPFLLEDVTSMLPYIEFQALAPTNSLEIIIDDQHVITLVEEDFNIALDVLVL